MTPHVANTLLELLLQSWADADAAASDAAAHALGRGVRRPRDPLASVAATPAKDPLGLAKCAADASRGVMNLLTASRVVAPYGLRRALVLAQVGEKNDRGDLPIPQRPPLLLSKELPT